MADDILQFLSGLVPSNGQVPYSATGGIPLTQQPNFTPVGAVPGPAPVATEDPSQYTRTTGKPDKLASPMNYTPYVDPRELEKLNSSQVPVKSKAVDKAASKPTATVAPPGTSSEELPQTQGQKDAVTPPNPQVDAALGLEGQHKTVAEQKQSLNTILQQLMTASQAPVAPKMDFKSVMHDLIAPLSIGLLHSLISPQARGALGGIREGINAGVGYWEKLQEKKAADAKKGLLTAKDRISLGIQLLQAGGQIDDREAGIYKAQLEQAQRNSQQEHQKFEEGIAQRKEGREEELQKPELAAKAQALEASKAAEAASQAATNHSNLLSDAAKSKERATQDLEVEMQKSGASDLDIAKMKAGVKSPAGASTPKDMAIYNPMTGDMEERAMTPKERADMLAGKGVLDKKSGFYNTQTQKTIVAVKRAQPQIDRVNKILTELYADTKADPSLWSRGLDEIGYKHFGKTWNEKRQQLLTAESVLKPIGQGIASGGLSYASNFMSQFVDHIPNPRDTFSLAWDKLREIRNAANHDAAAVNYLGGIVGDDSLYNSTRDELKNMAYGNPGFEKMLGEERKPKSSKGDTGASKENTAIIEELNSLAKDSQNPESRKRAAQMLQQYPEAYRLWQQQHKPEGK